MLWLRLLSSAVGSTLPLGTSSSCAIINDFGELAVAAEVGTTFYNITTRLPCGEHMREVTDVQHHYNSATF